MARPKVSIIGGGNVGATAAMRVAEAEIADVVIVDIVEDMPQGKALDMSQMCAVLGVNVKVCGSNEYDETAGSDIIIITSGIARKPGMSRDDLLATNTKIIRQVVKAAVKKSPKAILILVTNPLDAMVYAAYKTSGFQKHRVMGMAGVLDSARFKTFIAEELNVSVENIDAFVLGGHGDDMVPLARYTTVSGIPLTDILPKKRINALIDRTRKGGAEIVGLLKTGSAFYAPGAAAALMAEAIIKDKKQVLPCCVLAEGEYGVKGMFAGLPVKLGAGGAEEIVEVDLTKTEAKQLKTSVASVKELCDKIDKIKG
ncbi:MAG: malate dehydrogenase [Candidatus Mycalebacterium zealandia]|nr:MAG: malate dehydrogenase [Candidatus Mycalebacterium zealandia]